MRHYRPPTLAHQRLLGAMAKDDTRLCASGTGRSSTWGDTFWGVDTKTRKGRNHLGRILMRVRKELQDG